MKVKIVSSKLDLLDPIRESGYFQDVSICDSLEEASDSDIAIVSSIIINHNHLSEFYNNRSPQTAKQNVFYMLTNDEDEQLNDLITNVCRARNITVIPPKMTVKQIVDTVIQKLFPEYGKKHSKVVAFFGAAGDVGTSMISQSVSEMLAQNTNYKIGHLILNDSMGTYYTNLKESEDISLDEIKLELFSNVLSSEKLAQTCIQRGNLFLLQAPRYLPDMRHFHPEHVEQLLDLASKIFDIIVVDAGANYSLGLTIGVLRSVNYKYLVTTQQEKPRKKFERVEAQIFKALQLKTTDFMIVINKFLKDASIYNGKQMADLYKMTLAATPPHLEFQGWQAEVDRKTLIHYDNPEFNEQIQYLARMVATQLKLDYQEQEVRKKSFLEKILNRGGAAS